jgi:hypothetical protein
VEVAGSLRVFALAADRPPPIGYPCSLHLDGGGLTLPPSGGGNLSRGARGDDRTLQCADSALLSVAAEEAVVRTARGRGRCTTVATR